MKARNYRGFEAGQGSAFRNIDEAPCFFILRREQYIMGTRISLVDEGVIEWSLCEEKSETFQTFVQGGGKEAETALKCVLLSFEECGFVRFFPDCAKQS